MSPEQVRGEADKIGPRSDVFGLGGVLYFLLLGRSPFPGNTVPEILARAQRGEWDRGALVAVDLPRPLVAVCSRAAGADA